MAKDLAVFDEATAKDIVQTITSLKASGLLGPQSSEAKQGYAGDQVWNTPAPLIVYNDSGYAVPAYGLMQMVDTLNEDGRNYIKIKRPIDSTLLRCPLLINGPTEIAIQGYGCAQPGPVYRLLHDGGNYVAGDRLGSLDAAFTATYGSLFVVIGVDEVLGVEPGDPKIANVMIDTSALYGKTKAGGLVIGTPASVLLYDASGSITTRELIAETMETDLPADSNVILISAYGRWRAILLPEVEIVQVTSNTKDADGYYPGNVQKFDTITKTWSTVRTCKVRDVNA